MRKGNAWRQRWLTGVALAAACLHAGCGQSHEVASDTGVPDPRDAGRSPTPDGGRLDGGRLDGGVSTQDAAIRDQALAPSDVAVDPPWDLDVAAWLDAGGCGEITVPYQSFFGLDEFVLVPGAALPRPWGELWCGVTVDLDARGVVESDPRGRCSPRVDAGTAYCSLSWSSPLTDADYLWLCRIEALAPGSDIHCLEWGE